MLPDSRAPDLRRRRFRQIPIRMLVPNVITLLAICAGLTAIRQSFAEIFSHGPNGQLKVSELRKHEGQTLAIHSVYETFEDANPKTSTPPLLATNVYLLTPNGWRMIVHHASLSPQGTTAEEQGVLRILH